MPAKSNNRPHRPRKNQSIRFNVKIIPAYPPTFDDALLGSFGIPELARRAERTMAKRAIRDQHQYIDILVREDFERHFERH